MLNDVSVDYSTGIIGTVICGNGSRVLVSGTTGSPPFFDIDCPQSTGTKSLSSGGPSSLSISSEFSISAKRCWEMSSSLSNGGKVIFVLAK